MSQIKVSQLPQTTSLSASGNDFMMIVQNGFNKRITFADFFKSFNTDTIVNSEKGPFNFTVNGDTKDNLLKTYGQYNTVGVGLVTGNPESLFHIAGDCQIGGAASPGNLVVSSEEITVPASQSSTIFLSSSHIVTKLKTLSSSASTISNFDLNAPTKTQLKIISFSEADPTKASGMTYVVSGDFLGFTTVKFSKLGDSVSLLGTNNKWIVTGYNGVTFA